MIQKNHQMQPLAQWNQTNADFPLDKCVHQLFEEQVERTPDAIAVIFEESHLIYRELNNRANQLAHHLISLGIKPETLVGICVERSLEMVIGLFGILKAGGAYVPLDPSYPQERLAFMMKDAQVPVLLTQKNLLAKLPEQTADIICLDTDWQTISENSSQKNPISGATPDNLAYVIYTSGSTGQPKGVAIEHRNTVMLLVWANSIFTPTQIAGVLASTSICFDLSVFELFVPLSWGGQVILVENALRLPMLPPDCNVTLINTVPSAMTELIRNNGIPASVRVVNLAGEPLQNILVQQIYQIDTVEKVFNLYGPSEDTTYSTFALIKKGSQELPSIGLPITNTQAHILDHHLQPVPTGEVGELHISGAGLARGYLNRPQLTAEKFIFVSFGEEEAKVRLYKTGDLASYLPDGNIKFLGRVDHQVKIRGFRIELGEIEAKLYQYPDMSDAAVIAREDIPGDKRLVAYIVVSQLPPQRVLLRSEGQIKCVIAEDDNTHSSREVTTFDISYGGVGLAGVSAMNCQPGKRLYVCLRLPDMSEELCVAGNIAWQRGDRVGIQFDPTPEQKILLHKNINIFFENRGLLKVLQNTFIEHLRHFLEESLPDYMVPSQFVMLDALPLTPNGKLDRKALPAPNVNRSDLYTDIEEKLVKIWASVLRLERVGLHDNFLQLGGHSLQATQIISQLNEELSIDLPLYCLFEVPTVAQLAGQVEDMLKSSCPYTLALEQVDRNINIPLSFPQQQLWLLSRLIPDIPVYNEPFTIHLKEAIDVIALERSLNEILHRHEALRTTFAMVDGQPIQVISPSVSFALQVIDLREVQKGEREAECWRLATQEAIKPFDLTNGPLFRVTLMHLESANYRLCWTFHHIISDGVSFYNVLFPELATIYKAFVAGQPSPLPKQAFQYADYASWQRQWLQGEVLKPYLAYWKQQLANLPTLQLPTDHPRSAVQTYRGARYCLALSKKLTESLKALSQQEGVTLFMTLLVAFKTLLHRHSGQDDISVGTVTSGRNHSELENVMGIFVNTLVLRTDLSDNPNFKQLLQQVQKITLEAYAHENLPFELLVKELHPERHLSSNPFFQVAFVFQPQVSTIDLGWLPNQLDVHTSTAKFDLTMDLEENSGRIIGRIEYNTDLFDEETIIRIIGHYQTILEGIVATPELSISQLPLLTTNEQQQFLNWNKSPLEQCVHELFEAQVERNPNAVAVVFETQKLTYWELNNRANQLAHYLRKLGVKSETLVGVFMERSLEMIVGILGVLKAGGAYVPLEPTYPQERLNFMLKDAQIQILLTQKRLRTSDLIRKLPFVICLDSEWEDIANESDKNPISKTRTDNLAYVIYTSGSTGQPKGVEIRHVGLVNLILWHQNTYHVTLADRATLIAGISFDASVWETWPYLASGASIHIPDESTRISPPKLLEWLTTEQITLCFLPTPLAQAVLKQQLPNDLTLRALLTGGDKLQMPPDKVLSFDLVNHYGPTENTVVTTWVVVNNTRNSGSPPIGRPITNTHVYVLDKHMQEVPIGVSGELYIGGIGLARGYLNSPELTAEKFIHNPFNNAQEARLYKTGDLVRYLSDGNLEFLGRIDHQVKIRGFRIELGEIESILTQHPQIREIVVMVREDIPGDKRLIAYGVAKKPVPSTSELHQFLANKLPEYMIPSAFVSLEALPLTPNGKVDRKALPKPQKIQREAEASYVAPQTQLEQTIATVWQEVLHVENVGIQDSFFELGGHSLLVVQMHEKLVKALNRQISVTVLFQYLTIQALAQHLSESNSQPTMIPPKVRSARAAKMQAAKARKKQSHKTRQTELA